MTKLPINFLLYLAICGLLAAGGHQFWQALQEQKQPIDQKQTKDQFDVRLQAGRADAGRASVGPDYAAATDFWNSLKTANFTGKLPPEPVDPAAEQKPVEEEPAVPEVRLEDVFAVECMVFDGQSSRVVLRYKPSANVTPPPEVLEALGQTGGTGAGPGDAVPGRNGSPAPRAGTMPSFAAGASGLADHLMVDDTLWKPYEHVRLVRVDDEARFAVFRVENPAVEKEEWREEQMFPEGLPLSQEVLRKLAEGGMVSMQPSAQSSPEDEGPVSPPQGDSGWVDTQETREVSRNRFNVGRQDTEHFRADPHRIFNEDIGTASWRSSYGNMTGVKITRIAPGYERYGVQQGEIVLAINGEPVSGKPEAMKIGKRLYRSGVRTFQVDFLTPTGQRVTRTYVAPDE